VSLGHPNIVSVVGIGQHANRAFLVEERPDGVSLRQWVRQHKGAVTLEQVGRIADGIATALQRAHGAGVPHGGLDASCINVAFVQPRGLDLRVSAFGLFDALRAQRSDVPQELWDSLSPEGFRGAPPTEAGDLFSAAVVLIEALTGTCLPHTPRVPWREMATLAPRELRATLAQQRDDVPEQVWWLLSGMLAPEARARIPASAHALAASLRKIVWEPKVQRPPERVRRSAAAPPPAAVASSAPAVPEVRAPEPPRVPEATEPVPRAPAAVPTDDDPFQQLTTVDVETRAQPQRLRRTPVFAQTVLDLDESQSTTTPASNPHVQRYARTLLDEMNTHAQVDDPGVPPTRPRQEAIHATWIVESAARIPPIDSAHDLAVTVPHLVAPQATSQSTAAPPTTHGNDRTAPRRWFMFVVVALLGGALLWLFVSKASR
jgi:serine/threonine protein kinase